MDGRQRQPMAMPDLAAEAETLIRALRGVRHVRVQTDEHGVSTVHVTATDDDAAENLAGHVRSALLAGLATPIVPGRIHVRVDDDDDANGRRAALSDRVRLLHDTDPEDRSEQLASGPDDPRHAEAPDAPATERPPTARPRLVSVDVEHSDEDDVLCRVAIAFHTRVYRAEATAADLPGAAAHAAAEATVRALAEAGFLGLELLGLRDVEIAGRDYVIVALQRYDTSTRIRSASAPVIGSHVRAAALAALDAAEETD